MKTGKIVLILCLGVLWASVCFGAPEQMLAKKRILVVDSYHKNYAWSTMTNAGFCDAMLQLGYLDNKEQIVSFDERDRVESSKIIMQRTWLDSKKNRGKVAQTEKSLEITKHANEFRPDVIVLGDDNAAKYVGTRFLNSPIPVVFWGLNYTPVKYGLLESEETPGHNITGVYQTGYFAESMDLLTAIVPGLKTFAILSDESSTGRANTKAVEYLARKGSLPLKLTETVATNDYELWKRKALELQEEVDAFFIAMYSTLEDRNGNYVTNEDVAKWYFANIKIPEATVGEHFVKQGMLCSADDSGHNQGYLAGTIVHEILSNGAIPATYAPRVPKRGLLMVNNQRAKRLGIDLADDMGIEEIIRDVSANKEKIMVVSSYHNGFPWSKDTNKGFCDAMLKFGYFDNTEQVNDFNTHSYAETATIIIEKLWLDSKRKSSKAQIEEESLRIYEIIQDFKPDLVFLGDDNAARYVGSKLLDTNVPIVFWGINHTPVKYGLVDNEKRPGHNVTGVYQSMYHRENIELLMDIVPTLKTFAVLSNDTITGRSNYKQIEFLARRKMLPMTLIETAATNDWEMWKQKALELQEKVDAFYIAHFQGLMDKNGDIVPNATVVDWYLNHIKIPETTVGMNVKDGFLCGALDLGYNQGYQAVEIAQDILAYGASPATYPPKTPSRGPLTVHRKRARQLGITLTEKMGIEDYID